MPIGFVATERCYCNKCSEWKPETDFSLIGRAQHKAEDENAMCQACVDMLWKKRLGRDEIQAFVREDRSRLLQRTRNGEFEEMVGEGRIGTVMHHSEFIRRLAKVIPNLVPGPAYYIGDISLYKVLGDSPQFICWISEGTMQEFSSVLFNKDRQPVKEIRGWRTALLRCIKCGIVSEEQAQKEFGLPSSPQQAKFWNKQLYTYRNDRTIGKG